MSNLIWLSDKQMRLWEPHFPHHFRYQDGLHWRDAPADYGPHKIL